MPVGDLITLLVVLLIVWYYLLYMRQVDDRLHVLVVIVQLGKLGLLLQRLFQRDADLERNQLGNAIDKTIRMTQHTTDIAHHGLGGHGAVSDDLGHLVAAEATEKESRAGKLALMRPVMTSVDGRCVATTK